MKKYIYLFVFSFLCLAANAQDGQLKQMVEKGVQTCERQADNHEWKEAFATLRNLDATLGTENPDLHYLVSKQRFRLYFRINRKEEAKSNMAAMESFARQSKKADVIEDMLMAKAYYLRNTGSIGLAQQCYREVFNMHSAGKDTAGMDKTFQSMLAESKQQGNTLMTTMLEGMYTQWKDSIASVKAANELRELKVQFDEAKQLIEEKDSTISAQGAFIVVLIILSVALAVGLVFFILVMFRNVRKIKKLKTSYEFASANNEQKSIFLKNIGSQIEPSLAAIAAGDSKKHVKALQDFLSHLKNYIEIENNEERYKLTDTNLGTVIEKIVTEAKEGAVSLPLKYESHSINFATNKEVLKELLLSLFKEICTHKDAREISVDIKKRNPHTVHCIVTAIGMSVEAEKRASLFQAFAEVNDLAVNDGLTLPTCYLMANKMNGLLRLDEDFKNGTRFVIELHSK